MVLLEGRCEADFQTIDQFLTRHLETTSRVPPKKECWEDIRMIVSTCGNINMDKNQDVITTLHHRDKKSQLLERGKRANLNRGIEDKKGSRAAEIHKKQCFKGGLY